jgi:hypothetical protein
VGDEGDLAHAGMSVASAGDVDDDGYDDILVGAPMQDDGGYWAGKTYLILGSSLDDASTIHLSDADYAFIGESSGDNAGFSVSSAGDVDGDGFDDILVGASDNGETPKAYLILGSGLSDASEIDLSLADYTFVDPLGTCAGLLLDACTIVSSAGDVDGDGLDDILVGGPWQNPGDDMWSGGKVYLFLGSSLGEGPLEIDLSLADYTFLGESAGDQAGVSVSSAGDVDGDGLDDLLVGADRNDDVESGAGKVYLILGSSLGDTSEFDLSMSDFSFVGEGYYEVAGHSVSGAGDVNGDGFSDIIVGAPGVHSTSSAGFSRIGKTYLILGGL